MVRHDQLYQTLVSATYASAVAHLQVHCRDCSDVTRILINKRTRIPWFLTWTRLSEQLTCLLVEV